jgi:hypothetical protein
MEKIEIDWDIHKLIESERRGFDEPPYVALRRLLKLPPLTPMASPKETVSEGIPWSEEGVVVPHGSAARMEYLRGSQVYEGQFLNGRLVVDGQSFDTLSAAASALALTKDGSKTSLNGWQYWKVRFPSEKNWKSLDDLRRMKNRYGSH